MEFNAVLTLLLVLLLGLLVASLLVDVNFLAVLGTTETFFLVDADLLLDVGVAVVGSGSVSVDGG